MNSRVNPVGGVEVIEAANREDTGADEDRLAGTVLTGAGVAKTKQNDINKSFSLHFMKQL